MSLYKMMISLILVVSLVTVSRGNIIGIFPPDGACLCFNANSVEIRSDVCGETVGIANASECHRYTEKYSPCSPHDMGSFDRYEYRIDYRGKEGWAHGVYLDWESDSNCSTSATVSPDEYTCELIDEGMRVHEETTIFDCADSDCKNTCKGGQSAAYVKCRCTAKDGIHPPIYTEEWSPGQKLTTADGKCNRNITENTAIATFNSNGTYTEHAAVFIKCQDDYTIQVYDQWCGRSVGYSTYNSSHRFFNSFATIISDRFGPTSISCRIETSGSTNCAACNAGCPIFCEEESP